MKVQPAKLQTINVKPGQQNPEVTIKIKPIKVWKGEARKNRTASQSSRHPPGHDPDALAGHGAGVGDGNDTAIA